MRYSLLATLLIVTGASVALAQETATPAPTEDPKPSVTQKRTVRLNNLVLEELKTSNPRHYAEAQRVIAAASELCAPGALEVSKTLRMPPAHCTGEFLRTSNPPKREISFRLDDTLYIALVTLKDAGPEFHRIDQEVEPAMISPAR